jgi:predicted HTH domain antitoxin
MSVTSVTRALTGARRSDHTVVVSTMRAVTLQVPTGVSDDEARLLVAIGLFIDGRVSLGKAAELAGFSRRAFMEILAHRGISVVKYAPDEVDEDLAHA